MPAPVVTSALIGAGSSLLGNVLGGVFSGKSARKQNQMAIAEAKKQRDFQERMSSTAYQRSAKDLEKAGLNRILALGSPASSGAGASAPIVGELEGAATSARSAAADVANILNIRANTAKTVADTSFTQSKERLIGPAGKIADSAGGLIDWVKGKLGSGSIDYKNLISEYWDELRGQGLTARALARKFAEGKKQISQYLDWIRAKDRSYRKPKDITIRVPKKGERDYNPYHDPKSDKYK